MLHHKPRIEERTKAMIRASLRGAGPERDACILDVSSRGLLAMAADPPGVGRFVELLAGNHSLVGQVRWVNGRRFGIALRQKISVFALVTGESGPVTLKERESERKTRSRAASDGSVITRRIEFVAFAAAGAAATFIVAGYANEALHSLDGVKQALGGNPIESSPSRLR